MSSAVVPTRDGDAQSVERILVVSPWGLDGGYSGPLTLMHRLLHRLHERGAAVIDVVYRDRGREEGQPSWARNVTPVRAREPYSRMRQIWWGLRVRRHIRRTRFVYDVIHLHGFYLANQIAIAGYSGSAKVVVLPVLEGGDLGARTVGRVPDLKRAMLRIVLRAVDVGLALSEQIAKDFEDLGLAAAQVHIIGNPANEELFAIGAQRRAPHDPRTVGFLGKVGGFKNPDLVLRALRIGLDRGRDWRGIFVGPFPDPKTEAGIREIVTNLRLEDHVEFAGYQTAVASFVEQMDVFVLPSSREGLPGALTEAMAAALPCVVTDQGSMAHHVNSSNAGFVVREDAAAIADAIDSALSEEWTLHSTAAHAYAVRHFSPDAVAETYRSALSRSRAAGVCDESH